MKHCIVCNVDLDGSNTTWYRQKNYIHKCNDCMKLEKKEQSRLFRLKSPDIVNSRSKKYLEKLKAENPVKYTARQQFSSAKKRANALGLEFNLTTEFIESISPKVCPILLKVIKYGGGEKTNSSSSIDRIDSNRGYTRDNVQIICNLANLMKSNATVDEMINFSSWIYFEHVEKIKGVSREK